MHTFNFQAMVTPDGILSSLMGPFILGVHAMYDLLPRDGW